MSLKHVYYGIIHPHEDPDNWLLPAYKWLSFHCGYCPQIWLARSNSSITGFKNSDVIKKRRYSKVNRNEIKANTNSVLFEFQFLPKKDIFYVSYNLWCMILSSLCNMNVESEKIDFDKEIRDHLNAVSSEVLESDLDQEDDYILRWKSFEGELDQYLKENLFIESDQIVVPKLDLKKSSCILCKNDNQKRQLEHMGFSSRKIKIKKNTNI